MNRNKTRFLLMTLVAVVTLGMDSLPALAKDSRIIEFSRDTPGAEAKAFSSLIGVWHVDRDGARTVYAVDGKNWVQGVMAPAVGEKAKSLYGHGASEFLRNLEKYRYFPLTVLKEVKDFKEGIIEVTFKPVSGRIDQAAGIAFNIKPNGDYLVIRANAQEENLVFFKLDQGRRSTVQWINKVPVPSNRWQTLKVVVNGRKIEGYLNGTKYVDYLWSEDIDGRIGLWSKADSYVFFDKVSVTTK
ncbi:hypothetical protein Gbem_2675 [Citrifermentans bemidjiense Bem]|uniref:3-keto-alpha-glucoside-1,2-lyase/3-keto-2-hydroxy-glucal hydratase domain-containing protein n=1 Tax=Citrifermentans bemidjiense (strain ATCC BAA-1014 / DSM 16622 / JCM 12645 / Bem) TaxID=404380 RepID=B5EHE7_CITBB|nr:family 16 glycoside hydrolase [Citrifermentans bemidjiense]ACH39683.1 hypothetical protein Gbem_2675 [Citrifermentans bemidjiense Bem]